MQNVYENVALYALVGLAFSIISLDTLPHFKNKRKIKKALLFMLLWVLWPIASVIVAFKLLKVFDD